MRHPLPPRTIMTGLLNQPPRRYGRRTHPARAEGPDPAEPKVPGGHGPGRCKGRRQHPCRIADAEPSASAAATRTPRVPSDNPLPTPGESPRIRRRKPARLAASTATAMPRVVAGHLNRRPAESGRVVREQPTGDQVHHGDHHESGQGHAPPANEVRPGIGRSWPTTGLFGDPPPTSRHSRSRHRDRR